MSLHNCHYQTSPRSSDYSFESVFLCIFNCEFIPCLCKGNFMQPALQKSFILFAETKVGWCTCKLPAVHIHASSAKLEKEINIKQTLVLGIHLAAKLICLMFLIHEGHPKIMLIIVVQQHQCSDLYLKYILIGEAHSSSNQFVF